MVADKQLGNRTPNYHIFDMLTGARSRKRNTHSGNYMGKLRTNSACNQSVLFGPGSSSQALRNSVADEEYRRRVVRPELGVVLFDASTFVDCMRGMAEVRASWE